MIFLSETDKLYFDKITESMIRDKDQWVAEYGRRHDYNYKFYKGPLCINYQYETYYFTFEGRRPACIFENNPIDNWCPGFFTCLNIFSKRVRAFTKAKKTLEKYVNQKVYKNLVLELNNRSGNYPKCEQLKNNKIESFISKPVLID